MKKCSKCQLTKTINNFGKDISKKGGLNIYCKSCIKEKTTEWAKNNPEKVKIAKRKYNKTDAGRVSKNKWKNNNPDKVKASKRRTDKTYREKNRATIRERDKRYQNKRFKTDIDYKLRSNLRSRLCQAIRNNQKSGSAVKDLGCSIKYLKQHLEAHFKKGMTWKNYGEWHIDHIKPLAAFDLTDRKQFLEACHYTNLQPLWAEENLKKGGLDK